MKIYIDTYDVTNYVLEEKGLELTLERERATHERVVNDVNLNFSNLNGFFNTLFQSASSTIKYWVKVYSDTEINLDFYGVVDLKSVIYDALNASVTSNAFSSEREFWDRIKNGKINKTFSFTDWGYIYQTLEQIINRQLRGGFSDLFTSVSVEIELSLKNIRFYSDFNLPTGVGIYGKYKDLDPETTVFDLFTAFCINYNAEFYIDNNTKTLHFRRRKAVTSTNILAIDDKLIEDSEIDVKLIDDDKYDYVECLYKLPKPSTVINITGFTGTFHESIMTGRIYEWVMTYNYANGIESNRSELSRFQLMTAIYIPGEGWTLYYKMNMTIPSPTDINVMSVNLYRRCTNVSGTNLPLTSFRKIATILSFPNNYVDYLADSIILNNLSDYPQINDAVDSQTVWVSYDDSTKSWKDVIFNNQDGANQPVGKIFQSIPKLNWIDPITQNTISDSVYMFYFFGMETDISFLMDTWKDLMTIKHKLTASINDVSLSIGDSVTTKKLKLFPGFFQWEKTDTFRVTKATKDLIKRETAIEGVTI